MLYLNEKKALFLGDSHANSIVRSLLKLGYSKGNPLSCEFIKIAHHGSRHNTTSELLEFVFCNKFIFLTDGTGNSYHPHKDVLEIILKQCVAFGFKECYFYFNYISVKENINIINIPDGFNVNLICTDEIILWIRAMK